VIFFDLQHDTNRRIIAASSPVTLIEHRTLFIELEAPTLTSNTIS